LVNGLDGRTFGKVDTKFLTFEKLKKIGFVELTTSMLGEGTKNFITEQISAEE